MVMEAGRFYIWLYHMLPTCGHFMVVVGICLSHVCLLWLSRTSPLNCYILFRPASSVNQVYAMRVSMTISQEWTLKGCCGGQKWSTGGLWECFFCHRNQKEAMLLIAVLQGRQKEGEPQGEFGGLVVLNFAWWF